MPTYAGSPLSGERRATPLLPIFGILNSRRSSKSVYSFSVMSQPPPPPLTKRTPSSAPQTSILPVAFQPVRSLRLKSGVKPGGGLVSPLRTAGGAQSSTTRGTNSQRLIAGASRERQRANIKLPSPLAGEGRTHGERSMMHLYARTALVARRGRARFRSLE